MIKRFFLVLLCLAAALTVFTAAAEPAPNEDVVVNKYIFYVDGAVYKTAVLVTGDTLNQPENPTKADHRFAGWYADETLSTPYAGFGTPITADGSEIKIYAKFEKVFHIVYLDDQNAVLQTVEVGSDENGEYKHTFSKDFPMFQPQPVNNIPQVNDGWKDQNGVTHTTDTVAVTQNLTLTPVLKPGYYAHFFTGGGSFVPSQYLNPGDTVARPDDDPTRQGYAFAGWYNAAEGGELFDFNTAPAGAVDIYAHWEPAETVFTVIIMLEDTDNIGHYSFYTSYQHAGFTGQSTEEFWTTEGDQSDAHKAKHFVGGSYNYEIEPIEHKIIEADGSTVLVVYSSLYVYHIQYGGVTYTLRGGQSPIKDILFKDNDLEQLYNDSFQEGKRYYLVLFYGGKLANFLPIDNIFPFPYRINERASAYSGLPPIPNGATFTSRVQDANGSYLAIHHSYYETLDSSPENRKYSEPVEVQKKVLHDEAYAYSPIYTDEFSFEKVIVQSRQDKAV